MLVAMPTVLRTQGYRFFFFSLESREPPHVHVERAEQYAKVWLESLTIAQSKGFRSGELSEIIRIVRENRLSFLEQWDEHFKRQI
jgi:hypothetical protein